MEFLKDYGFELHPGIANVVADDLSWKAIHVSSMMVKEAILIEEFRDLSLVTQEEPSSIRLGMLPITNEFLNRIRELPSEDEEKKEKLTFEEKELDLYEETNEI